jgi:formyl-CoA transferase
VRDRVLGDLGATVIKVEPPQGDITRRMGPMSGDVAVLMPPRTGTSRSFALDITQTEDAARARQMACEADVK